MQTGVCYRGAKSRKVMNFEYWCRCMQNLNIFCSGGGQAAVYDGGRWFLLLVALGSSFLPMRVVVVVSLALVISREVSFVRGFFFHP